MSAIYNCYFKYKDEKKLQKEPSSLIKISWAQLREKSLTNLTQKLYFC